VKDIKQIVNTTPQRKEKMIKQIELIHGELAPQTTAEKLEVLRLKINEIIKELNREEDLK